VDARPKAPSQGQGASAAPAAPAGLAAEAAGPKNASPAGRAKRAALRFEAAGGVFPIPLVDVVVAGFPTTMIVDTGASHHVIGEWLAKETQIPVGASGDRVTDHAGREVGRVRRAEDVKISISGWGAMDVPLMLVFPLPEPLRKLGIGGVIAPHLLAAEGHATLLDLRSGSMIEEAEEEAAKHEGELGGARAFTAARACGGATAGQMLLVQAAVDGAPALLKLDSGASSSSIFQASDAGKRAAAKAGGPRAAYGATGKFTARSVEGAKMKVGEFEVAVDLNIEDVAPAAGCPSDGYLGMDVLRSCVLVLRGERTSARCERRPD
jgi:hypothetical protein